MTKRYNDKMIRADDVVERPLIGFHFSGAGSALPPVVIKAATREEAEQKWREMNDQAINTNTQPEPSEIL